MFPLSFNFSDCTRFTRHVTEDERADPFRGKRRNVHLKMLEIDTSEKKELEDQKLNKLKLDNKKTKITRGKGILFRDRTPTSFSDDEDYDEVSCAESDASAWEEFECSRKDAELDLKEIGKGKKIEFGARKGPAEIRDTYGRQERATRLNDCRHATAPIRLNASNRDGASYREGILAKPREFSLLQMG
ncbi:hypothetical protein Trydic_g1377 [Trypoxylus dichotomus]